MQPTGRITQTEQISREARRSPVDPVQVRQAALSLFAERGYRASGMREIAQALGVRAASLYNHVGSKQEILVQIMTSMMGRLLADQATALASTADMTEQLRRATESHARYVVRHREEILIANQELPSLEGENRALVLGERDRYERGFRELIERGISAGRFQARSARLASYAIIDMGNGIAGWYREDGPLSEAEVAYHQGEFALALVGAA